MAHFSVKVYTDSEEFLREAVSRHTDRLSATELLERMTIQPAQRLASRIRAAA